MKIVQRNVLRRLPNDRPKRARIKLTVIGNCQDLLFAVESDPAKFHVTALLRLDFKTQGPKRSDYSRPDIRRSLGTHRLQLHRDDHRRIRS